MVREWSNAAQGASSPTAMRCSKGVSWSMSWLRLLCLACTFCVAAHAVDIMSPELPQGRVPGHPRQALRAFACGHLRPPHASPLRPAACQRQGSHASRRARAGTRSTQHVGSARMAADRSRMVTMAELELSLSEQVVQRYRVQKVLEELNATRVQQVEKEEWERILRMVEDEVVTDIDEEPGPWELSPDLQEEAEFLFSGKDRSPYLKIDFGDEGKGVDVLGSMKTIDSAVVQKAFDDALNEQQKKAPKTFLENLLGFDPLKSSSSSSSSSSSLDWGIGPGKLAEPIDRSYEARRELIELEIEEDYQFLVQRSAQLADKAWHQGQARFPREGHMVPWEVVEREVLALQNELLRLRDPPASRAAREEKEAFDKMRNALRLPEESAWAPLKTDSAGEGAVSTSGKDEGSESKGMARLLSSVMSDVIGRGDGAGRNDSMVISIGVGGLDVQRGPLSSIMQSQLDLELAEFRENVDAIRTSTEELIKDFNRWQPLDKRLPYSSVSEFRAYVLENTRNASAHGAGAHEEGGRIGSLGSEGVGFAEGGVRIGVGGLGMRSSEVAAGVDRELVLVGPWGSLESLLTTREEALAVMMQRRGFKFKGPIALNETELYQENLKWAELDEEAEAEWKFFSPEEYQRYVEMREARIKALTRRKERNYKIALASCEAEVSLDEYMGVMLDLGWAEEGKDLEIAQTGRSALSGSGRELGLDPRVEFLMETLAYCTYVALVLYPMLPILFPEVPADAGSGGGLEAWADVLMRNLAFWAEAASPEGLASGIDMFYQGRTGESMVDIVWNLMNE